jgi:hypothetical protein
MPAHFLPRLGPGPQRDALRRLEIVLAVGALYFAVVLNWSYSSDLHTVILPMVQPMVRTQIVCSPIFVLRLEATPIS